MIKLSTEVKMAKRYPPGPKGYLAFSKFRSDRPDRVNMLLNATRTYGDIVRLQMLPGFNVYLLNNPEYIHYVLVEHAEKFHKGPSLKRNTKDFIGEGLLTSEDGFHARQRRLVQPAFHHARIASYAETMVSYTERMLDNWTSGETRDIAEDMMGLTLHIVAKTLFDADVTQDTEKIGEAITAGIEFVNKRVGAPARLPDWLPTEANKKNREMATFMNNTIMRFIDDRRASGEDKGDLLSMLLLATDEGDGGQMTNQQAKDEAMTLFIAGHETTSNALSWTWYLLSQNPDVEARVHEELDRVLAGRAPIAADLRQLPYTEMVIKEAMRLHPPAWIMSRQAMEDVNIGGYDVAKGSLILISPYVMHRDLRYFEEPERFLPERWANDFEKRIPRYAYFPFGGGPRVCIGQGFAMMETQLILATIAQRYYLSLAPDQQVEMQPMITLRPRNGLRMTVKLRDVVKIPATAPVTGH
jgi:cytochrome P450